MVPKGANFSSIGVGEQTAFNKGFLKGKRKHFHGDKGFIWGRRFKDQNLLLFPQRFPKSSLQRWSANF